jgi:hypothetical protein
MTRADRGDATLTFLGSDLGSGTLADCRRRAGCHSIFPPPSYFMAAIPAIVGKLRTVCEYVGVLTPEPYCPFRFLDLPAEIRLLIFRELFGGSRTHRVLEWEQRIPSKEIEYEPNSFERARYRVHGHVLHLDHANTSCRFQSAVLRSCKTVYNEALPVLYANPVFSISMYAGREGNLPLVNAAHIRRITTCASRQDTLNEREIEEGYRSAGILWDKLLLLAVHIGLGLGSGIAKDGSADAIERAICGRTTPVEYEASDVEWLYKVESDSELRKLGICFPLLAERWYIRKGSTVLCD